MAQTRFLAVALVVNLARLLFIGDLADVVFAEEVRLAAVGGGAEVAGTAEDAVGL